MECSERKLFDALEAAEPQQAAAVLGNLAAQGRGGVRAAKLWTRFKRLLHRRGYYVATPAQLRASLDEIEAVGEGFDLYDLARGLAVYDAAQHELPLLKRFAPAEPPRELRKES